MNYLVFFLCIVLTIVSNENGFSQSSKTYTIDNGSALSGYDAVSYFQGKPVKGKKAFQINYQSAIYQFSSQENAQLFLTTPSKYTPAYGGWCAYAMGNSGEKVEVDPMTYKIVAGKLYLFYNSFFNNTLTDWNKDEQNLKAKADKNWLKIK